MAGLAFLDLCAVGIFSLCPAYLFALWLTSSGSYPGTLTPRSLMSSRRSPGSAPHPGPGALGPLPFSKVESALLVKNAAPPPTHTDPESMTLDTSLPGPESGGKEDVRCSRDLVQHLPQTGAPLGKGESPVTDFSYWGLAVPILTSRTFREPRSNSGTYMYILADSFEDFSIFSSNSPFSQTHYCSFMGCCPVRLGQGVHRGQTPAPLDCPGRGESERPCVAWWVNSLKRLSLFCLALAERNTFHILNKYLLEYYA